MVHIRPFWENPRQIGETGRTAYAAVFVDIDEERSHQIVETVVEALGPTDLNVYVGGGPAFYNDIQSVSESDLQRAEVIGLPFAAIVLLFVFGSVVAAAMPVAAGGATVLIGLSALWVLGQFTSFSIFALNVVTLIGLGLGADYSLFLVSRFREELAGADVDTALIRTVASAGRAVFFSGLAVLVGLSSLLIFEFMMLRSIGIGGAVVVFIAVLAAITLVPACLAVLGNRIDVLRIWRPRLGPGYDWQRVARAVMRRPLPIFVVVSALLIAMGIPSLHVRISAPDASVLPSDSPSRQALRSSAKRIRGGERRSAVHRHRVSQARAAFPVGGGNAWALPGRWNMTSELPGSTASFPSTRVSRSRNTNFSIATRHVSPIPTRRHTRRRSSTATSR